MHEGQGLNSSSSCQFSQYRHAEGDNNGWVSFPVLQNRQPVQPWKITPCSSLWSQCCPRLSDHSCCPAKKTHTTTSGLLISSSTTDPSNDDTSNMLKGQMRGSAIRAPRKYIGAQSILFHSRHSDPHSATEDWISLPNQHQSSWPPLCTPRNAAVGFPTLSPGTQTPVQDAETKACSTTSMRKKYHQHSNENTISKQQ